MTNAINRIDTAEVFFECARRAAQKADRGESFQTSAAHVIENIQDLPKAASEVRSLLSLKTKGRRSK